MLHDSIRALAFGFGGLLCLGGLAAISLGGAEAASGIVPLLIGAGAIVVAILQRNRYRSEVAEKAGLSPGPGGGESGWLEPQFRPTGELFTDPASGQVMRVWVDEATGQRRYRAEGYYPYR
jgi:hypothetical protein